MEKDDTVVIGEILGQRGAKLPSYILWMFRMLGMLRMLVYVRNGVKTT